MKTIKAACPCGSTFEASSDTHDQGPAPHLLYRAWVKQHEDCVEASRKALAQRRTFNEPDAHRRG